MREEEGRKYGEREDVCKKVSERTITIRCGKKGNDDEKKERFMKRKAGVR